MCIDGIICYALWGRRYCAGGGNLITRVAGLEGTVEADREGTVEARVEGTVEAGVEGTVWRPIRVRIRVRELGLRSKP